MHGVRKEKHDTRIGDTRTGKQAPICGSADWKTLSEKFEKTQVRKSSKIRFGPAESIPDKPNEAMSKTDRAVVDRMVANGKTSD